MTTWRVAAAALVSWVLLSAPGCTFYSFTAFRWDEEPARVVSAEARQHDDHVEARFRDQGGRVQTIEWRLDGSAPVSTRTRASPSVVVPVVRAAVVPPDRSAAGFEVVFNDRECCLGTATGWGEVQRRHETALVPSTLPWKLLPLTLLVDLALAPITLSAYIVLPMFIDMFPRR